MAYSEFNLGEANPKFDHTLQVESDQPVSLPDNFVVTQGGYERAGSDLIMSSTDGQQILLENFYTEQPSGIEQGTGFISYELATKLAGPQNPGQYAQATPNTPDESIGQIETSEGSVTVVHPNGTTETLQAGSAVYQGDIIRTGDGASVGITFKDESSFSLDEGGEIALDEMVYDPDSGDGAFSSTLTSGVFSFVSGQIAKANPDAMSITTPVATIGIRGTQGVIKQEANGPMEAALLQEASGFTGELTLTNSGGTITLNQPNQFSAIISFTSSPSQPIVLSSVQITGSFGNKVLRVLSRTQERAQERKAEEAAAEEEGAGEGAGEGTGEGAGEGAGEEIVVQLDTGEEIVFFIPQFILSNLYLRDKIIFIPPPPPKEEEVRNDVISKVEDAISSLTAFVAGTNAAESIFGNSGVDTAEGIAGFIGNDIIHAYGGNDMISGGYGNDLIYGGTGNDIIHGDDPGSDAKYSDLSSHFSSFSDAGDGSSYSSTTTGFTGRDDTIWGELGGDIIDGGDGNDFIYGGDGSSDLSANDNDTIAGGAGTDTIYGEYGNDIISGDTGNDYLSGGYGNDIITGGDGADIIYGNQGDDTIDGGDANDNIHGNDGADILVGGLLNDTIWGDTGNDTITGDTGDDVLYGDGGKGSSLNGDDVITGGDGNDTIQGNNGNDVIDGGTGNDIIYGDAGDTDGNDTLTGGEGIDDIYGGGGTDFLYGSAGADTLSGDAGADTLDGGADNDLLRGYAETLNNVYIGGDGVDTLDLDYGISTIIDVTLAFSAEGTGAISYSDTTATSFGTDTFTGIESVKLDAGADTVSIGAGLYASSLPTLDGGAGSDTLSISDTSFSITSGTGVTNITNFETLSLSLADTALTIDSGFASTGITTIIGGANDSVDMTSGWTQVTADNQAGYQVYNDGSTNLAISTSVTVTNYTTPAV